MTSHDVHSGIFEEGIDSVRQFEENWRRAARRTARMMSQELEHIRFDVGFRTIDVEGVTSDTVDCPHVTDELQRLLALALAVGKEEFVVRDICPASPTGHEGAAHVTCTAKRITRVLQSAFRASGAVPAIMRLSLRNGRFDLRVYLDETGATEMGVHAMADSMATADSLSC